MSFDYELYTMEERAEATVDICYITFKYYST